MKSKISPPPPPESSGTVEPISQLVKKKGLASQNQVFHWTHNNHLICGFHQSTSNSINNNIYFCKAGSIKRKMGTAFEEAQIAAKLICINAKKTGQDVVLCLSGGVDSSAMLSAFMASGVPFKSAVLRFNNNLNDFDIKQTIQFCRQNNISCDIFDLDVLDFFESGKYLEYGKTYQCQSPQLAVHLYLCDQIKGCPVFSWQAPEFFYHLDSENKNKPHCCFGLPGYLHSAYLRYFVQNKRFGVPFFFLYTAELLGSFYHLPLMQKLVWFSRKGANVHYSYELKCMAYRHSGFPVKPRKMKYTGFEKVKDHYDTLDNKSYGTAFNDRYRKTLEKLNPMPKSQYQVVSEDILSDHHQMKKLDERYAKELAQPEANPSILFEKEMVKLYQKDDVGVLVAPGHIPAQTKNIELLALSPSQIESKIWLCQELEKVMERTEDKKPVNIWILAGWYNILGFLLFSRERISIKKMSHFDMDKSAVEISKAFCSFWLKKGVYESSVKDCNSLKYDNHPPNIIINTACEHLNSWDWFKKLPKGMMFALQANNILHPNHPNSFRTLSDFKEIVIKNSLSQLLFEGAKSFDSLSAFQQFMLIGVK